MGMITLSCTRCQMNDQAATIELHVDDHGPTLRERTVGQQLKRGDRIMAGVL